MAWGLSLRQHTLILIWLVLIYLAHTDSSREYSALSLSVLSPVRSRYRCEILHWALDRRWCVAQFACAHTPNRFSSNSSWTPISWTGSRTAHCYSTHQLISSLILTIGIIRSLNIAVFFHILLDFAQSHFSGQVQIRQEIMEQFQFSHSWRDPDEYIEQLRRIWSDTGERKRARRV